MTDLAQNFKLHFLFNVLNPNEVIADRACYNLCEIKYNLFSACHLMCPILVDVFVVSILNVQVQILRPQKSEMWLLFRFHYEVASPNSDDKKKNCTTNERNGRGKVRQRNIKAKIAKYVKLIHWQWQERKQAKKNYTLIALILSWVWERKKSGRIIHWRAVLYRA